MRHQGILAILAILALLAETVAPQDPCTLQMTTDVQLDNRLCMGSVCLDAKDFENIKACLFPLDSN